MKSNCCPGFFGILAVALIVGCQSSLTPKMMDFEPAEPPTGLENLPDPIVRYEERLSAGNTTPYSVLG